VIRKRDGSGWRIDLPRDGQPSATALDGRGRTAGTGLVRTDELTALIEVMDRELATMELRRTARDVMLDGARLTDLADTTLAPRALLAELGPTVRSIRQRSRVPGELSLKRDVSDGMREELYVSRANLTARYASLPEEYRRLLDDAGFGRGLTTGIAELAAEAPQLPQGAAAPALPRSPEETFPRMAEPAPRSSAPAIQVPDPAFVQTGRPTMPWASEATIARLSESTIARVSEPTIAEPIVARVTEPTLPRTTAPAAVPPVPAAPAAPRVRAKPPTPPPGPHDRPTLSMRQEPRLFPDAAPADAPRPVNPDTTQIATLVGDGSNRKTPKLPSVLAASRARVEVASELSDIVTPEQLVRVPPRRFQTPTG
jgi:hypothetical protein